MPFLFARRPVPGKNALTHTKPAAFWGCALCHLRRGQSGPSFLLLAFIFERGRWLNMPWIVTPCVSACCCIFPKGEQNFLAAKRPCGQFADSFADSHEKGVTSFDVTPCNLWSQHADLNRGPTDYESVALPAELCWRIDRWPIQGESIACPRFKVKPFSFRRDKRFWGRLAAPTASGAQTGRKGRL